MRELVLKSWISGLVLLVYALGCSPSSVHKSKAEPEILDYSKNFSIFGRLSMRRVKTT